MCSDRAGQDRHVVASLQHTHNPPLGMGLRDRDELLRQDLEVLDLESQISDRVFGVSIEARADQDELRLDSVGKLSRAPFERPRGRRFVAVP